MNTNLAKNGINIKDWSNGKTFMIMAFVTILLILILSAIVITSPFITMCFAFNKFFDYLDNRYRRSLKFKFESKRHETI